MVHPVKQVCSSGHSRPNPSGPSTTSQICSLKHNPLVGCALANAEKKPDIAIARMEKQCIVNMYPEARLALFRIYVFQKNNVVAFK
jgi:hypothetical protein